MHTVLVLGGYGFFGTRISAALARNPNVRLLVAGRDLSRAWDTARALELLEDHAVRLDAASLDLPASLRSLGVDTLVHTAGPFQAQDYKVASDAVEARANYIDLADGRRFVSGIDALDEAARGSKVVVVSGAIPLPPSPALFEPRVP